MNNEPNKSAELTEKELEGIVGGAEQASPQMGASQAGGPQVTQAEGFASPIVPRSGKN